MRSRISRRPWSNPPAGKAERQAPMRCPSCAHQASKVVDSRVVQNGQTTRRRRECESCGQRFTTYERIDLSLPMVVKRDGRRETFNREKLLRGLHVACRKRPVETHLIDDLANRILSDLARAGQREIDSATIGDRVMAGLKSIDHVAYIRFASVYQSFEDLESFARVLKSLARP